MAFMASVSLTSGGRVNLPANAKHITIAGASIASYAISVDGTNFHSVTITDDVIVIQNIIAKAITVTFTGTAQLAFGD